MSPALRLLLQAAVPAAELATGGGGGGSTVVHLRTTASASEVGTGKHGRLLDNTSCAQDVPGCCRLAVAALHEPALCTLRHAMRALAGCRIRGADHPLHGRRGGRCGGRAHVPHALSSNRALLRGESREQRWLQQTSCRVQTMHARQTALGKRRAAKHRPAGAGGAHLWLVPFKWPVKVPRHALEHLLLLLHANPAPSANRPAAAGGPHLRLAPVHPRPRQAGQAERCGVGASDGAGGSHPPHSIHSHHAAGGVAHSQRGQQPAGGCGADGPHGL